MRLTVKLCSPASTTVRLTPSTVMEPLSTRYGARCGGSDTSTTSQCSLGVRRRTSPTPSTWPCTMWPPSRVCGVTARSRLTRSPGREPASDVLSSVSAITSAVQVPSVRSVTVRQQPLTAIESPRRVPSSTVAALMESRRASPCSSIAATVPSSSTMPVNIRAVLSRVSRTFASAPVPMTAACRMRRRSWSSIVVMPRSPTALAPAPSRLGAT